MKRLRAVAVLLLLALAVWGIEPSAATFGRVTTNAGNAFTAALD